MIFVDDILTYFRNLGHAAEYGTLAQLNEQLTSVDYAASTDGMVAFVRLIGEQRTVDGYDQCDIAVHLSWLCPLDFDGETMLSTQEQAKDTLKAWINHLRGGNTVTVSDDARWQFGYDDFAENVAWVAVRVTLTASAADCVPLSPEPPTPPPGPRYNIFCPQVLHTDDNLDYIAGFPSPLYHADQKIGYVSIILDAAPPQGDSRNYVPFINSALVDGYGLLYGKYITNTSIITLKAKLEQYGHPMTEETENWLLDNSGKYLLTRLLVKNGDVDDSDVHFLAAVSATRYESKKAFVYYE